MGDFTLTPQERALLVQFTNDIGSYGLKWLFVNEAEPREMMITFITFMQKCQEIGYAAARSTCSCGCCSTH